MGTVRNPTSDGTCRRSARQPPWSSSPATLAVDDFASILPYLQTNSKHADGPYQEAAVLALGAVVQRAAWRWLGCTSSP